ncbi:hypothetical protein HDU67_000082 [Dinochytrium kinnereticum]|nr:hypothetical protein HDU67_000082 [Dinochytrium kinnereticum]
MASPSSLRKTSLLLEAASAGDSAVDLLAARNQKQLEKMIPPVGDEGAAMEEEEPVQDQKFEEEAPQPDDVAQPMSPSPPITLEPPEELDYENFVENPIWTPETRKVEQLQRSSTTRSADNFTSGKVLTRPVRSLSHSVMEVRTRQRAISSSSTASTMSQMQRRNELLAFHQILEQPPSPIVGRERALKIKPSQLENLQLSLELILEHRRAMTPTTPSPVLRAAAWSVAVSSSTPKTEAMQDDVLDDYYFMDDSADMSTSTSSEMSFVDTGMKFYQRFVTSDSEDDHSDMELLDQMAVAALAAAQRAREHGVTLAMRNLGISDADVAAAAIASWHGDDASSLHSLSMADTSQRHRFSRNAHDRNSSSPVPSQSSLSRLSVSLASLSIPRTSPIPSSVGYGSSVPELMSRLDVFAVEMEGIITELNAMQDQLEKEIRNEEHRALANDTRLFQAMGLDGSDGSAGSHSPFGFYANDMTSEDGSWESRASPKPMNIDNDTDSIFELSPRMTRSKSGKSKAVRMMGISEKEEANLMRRSILPSGETAVMANAEPHNSSSRRQTILTAPGPLRNVINESDSDDSILPASIQRKKRPVSTMKALKMMGINDGEAPKSQMAFRPISMLNPMSPHGSVVSENSSLASLKSPPSSLASPKALKLMGLSTTPKLQIAPDAPMGRRRSIARATPSPTNSFSSSSFAQSAGANPVPLARTGSIVSFGSLRGGFGRRPSQATITTTTTQSHEEIDYFTDHDPNEDEMAFLEDDSGKGRDKEGIRRSKSTTSKAYKLMGIDPTTQENVPTMPQLDRRRSSTPSEDDIDALQNRNSRRRSRSRMSRIGARNPSVPPPSTSSDTTKPAITVASLFQDTLNPPSMQGYLQKHNPGKMFRAWKRRFFVLVPSKSRLFYFASAEPGELAVGVIPMDLRTDVASARNAQFKGKPVIQITGQMTGQLSQGASADRGEKFWYLLADDEAAKGAWMNALVEVIMAAKPGSINTSFGGMPFVPATSRNPNLPPGTDGITSSITSGRRPSLGLLNIGAFGMTGNTSNGLLDIHLPSPISTQKALPPIANDHAGFEFKDSIGGSQDTLYSEIDFDRRIAEISL